MERKIGCFACGCKLVFRKLSDSGNKLLWLTLNLSSNCVFVDVGEQQKERSHKHDIKAASEGLSKAAAMATSVTFFISIESGQTCE